MSATKLSLAQPVLGLEEERQVLEVLRSGRLSLGPKLLEFERDFASWLGVQHVSAVSSGTAGLHLALRAVGVSPGDEVITSPFSFVASANAIVYEGARPVFVDIDPQTLNLDVSAVHAAITERTKAILPVHIFGYPADVPSLERLKFPIVEDACEALGAFHSDGKRVGARGNPSVFAFYANKQLTTGEGGLVVCDSPELKAVIDSERNQGRAPDMAWLDHDRLGFNYRLSDLACALGVAQLKRLDAMLTDRAQVAAWYYEALADIEELTLPCEDQNGDRRSWFVFVVQLPARLDRGEIIRQLGAVGIEAKPYLPAIHLMSFYRQHFGYSEGMFPVCERVASCSLALPFFPQMAQSQVEWVSQQLKRILENI